MVDVLTKEMQQSIPLAREINDGMPAHMLALMKEALAEAGRKLAGARVILLGVAYLENADDTRNTPAAALAKLPLARGAEVVAHDPYVRDADGPRALNPQSATRNSQLLVPLTNDLWEALNGADCAALVTRHREYQRLKLRRMKDLMRTPVLVDGRNVFDLANCVEAGFVVRAVGKTGTIEGPVGVQSRNSSNARIYSLGWQAKGFLEEGISLTYPWPSNGHMSVCWIVLAGQPQRSKLGSALRVVPF